MLTGALIAGLSFALGAACARATPITPSRDDEVIETLPAVSGSRGEERRARQQLAARPRDPALALAVAHRYLHALFGGSNPRVLVRALRYAEPSSDALSYVEFQADRAFAVRDAGHQAMGRPNAGP